MASKNKTASAKRVSVILAGIIFLMSLSVPAFAWAGIEEPGTYEKNFCLTPAQKQYVIGRIESAIAEVTTSGMSDLEKYYKLAIWENKRVKYDDDFWNFGYNYDNYRHQWDAYGALTEKSVCVGMSMLYANLCHAADLPCKFVRFKPGEVEHTLNYVPDINGNAYYVDVTENYFLMSDKNDSIAGKIDKAFSNITKDCTETTFEYTSGTSKELSSTDIKECYGKSYRDWFDEYALHMVDPKKQFSTDYVEKGSGDGTRHASYQNFGAYPVQPYPSRSSEATGIWFLDDFYEEPADIRSKILNRTLDGQLLEISGIKDNYDCATIEELKEAVSNSIPTITYFPSVENGKIVASSAELRKGRDYEVTYSGHDASTNEEVFDITGIGDYSGTYKLKIQMNFAAVKKAPVRKRALVYSGSPQELVEPGTAENGTMVYAVCKAGDPEPASQLYAPSIPTATDSGNYYVWYMVKGNTGHFDTPAKRIMGTVKIDPQEVALTNVGGSKEMKIGDTFTLTPGTDPVIEAVFSFSSSNDDVVKVSKDGVLRGVGEGKAEILVKAEPKSPNYSIFMYRIIDISVVKQKAVVTATPSAENQTHNGSADPTTAPTPAPAVNTYKNELELLAGLKVSQTGSKVRIKWGKVTDANLHEVWGGYCGKKARLLKTVNGINTRSVTIKKLNGKKLKLNKNYKFYVAAYKSANGTKTLLAKSFTAHIVGRKNNKETNVKKIKLKKKSYTLKVGKTARIKGELVRVDKNKKLLSTKHGPRFLYASSNKAVATVTKKGKIRAKGKGECVIYVYAINGNAAKIKVTVK